MKKNIIIGLIVAISAILIDQVSKIIMVSYLGHEYNTVTIIDGFFSLSLYYNKGAAFSMFEDNFIFLMIMTVLATVVFAYMAYHADFKTKKFYSFGVYMMIGGMVGNFIDRVFNYDQGVVDFLAFTFWDYNFAIFNIADSFLVVGVICVMLDVLFLESKRTKLGKEE